MKILIVAGYYPPHAPSAATRINKLSRYLLERGYDLHVLTIKNLPFPQILPPEVSDEHITYTDFVDVKNLLEQLVANFLGHRRPASKQPYGYSRLVGSNNMETVTQEAGGSRIGRAFKKLLRPLRNLYSDLVTWPDSQVGWLPYGTKAGLELIARDRPDVIYASAPPHTSLLLARRLSRITGVPWIAELRDLWTDHPYYNATTSVRRWIESRQEYRVMRDASAFVTVTEPWRSQLQKKYGKPTILVMNGFDSRDYPENPADPSDGPDVLSIVYTGALYAEKRDPDALFAALANLGDRGKPVKVRFFGPDLFYVEQLVKRYGLGENVELHAPVSYAESVRVQRQADILLLLRWDHPGEQTVVPGKLFEYFGARRPILSVGCEDGVAADMIKEREAGIVTRSPEVIAEHLERWIAVKKTCGKIAPLPVNVRDGMSRSDQFALLEAFLKEQIEADALKN